MHCARTLGRAAVWCFSARDDSRTGRKPDHRATTNARQSGAGLVLAVHYYLSRALFLGGQIGALIAPRLPSIQRRRRSLAKWPRKPELLPLGWRSKWEQHSRRAIPSRQVVLRTPAAIFEPRSLSRAIISGSCSVGMAFKPSSESRTAAAIALFSSCRLFPRCVLRSYLSSPGDTPSPGVVVRCGWRDLLLVIRN